MTLYIYRVGWTYPARNHVYRSKSMKNPSCIRTLPGPVRPVGPTGQTGRSYRSDRSVPAGQATVPRPVRPVGANFGCQQWPPTKQAYLMGITADPLGQPEHFIEDGKNTLTGVGSKEPQVHSKRETKE